MSDSQSTMTRLGFTNASWGVCGFTSTCYAMYDLNPAVRPQVVNATSGYRVLAEIKTYLALLRAESSPLQDAITDFTRSFGGPFAAFTIAGYVASVNKATGKSRAQILDNEKYGIALPPAAVADYVQRMWRWKASIKEFGVGTGRGDGIVGVSSSEYDATGNRKPFHGLEHYMYRSGGKIYSWGQSFGSVQEASRVGAGGVIWRVCYTIDLMK